MARPKSTDGRIEDLGALITAAHGLDRSWVDEARCRHHETRPLRPSPWQVDPHQVVDGIDGKELIKAALMICHACPAQYECANYAVESRAKAGTWGMAIVDLLWLQRQPDRAQIIARAQVRRIPLQTHVPSIRLRVA